MEDQLDMGSASNVNSQSYALGVHQQTEHDNPAKTSNQKNNPILENVDV